jgi:hypothetical protein
MRKTTNPHILFDNTNFGDLMLNAECSHSEGEDVCHACGEHMLDCECDEEEAECSF